MRNRVTSLVLGLAWAGVITCQAAAPRIEFEKTESDFGTISQVQEVKGVFVFRNTGDSVLNLQEPTTSCGCIVAAVNDKTVSPGHRGEITFTLTMPSARSVMNRQIFVESNDPQNPKITLTAKATYIPIFEIQPLLVPVNVRSGQTANVAVVVRRTDGKPLNLTKIEPTKPWIKAKPEQALEPGTTETRILIEATPEGSPRYFTEWVRIFCDKSKEPVLSAVLMGRVLGDLSVNPDTLVWDFTDPAAISASKPDEIGTRRLSIKSTAASQLQLSNVVCTLKQIEVDLIPGASGNTYDLVAKVVKVPKTTMRGTITFDTNLPNESAAQVPVTIKVANQ